MTKAKTKTKPKPKRLRGAVAKLPLALYDLTIGYAAITDGEFEYSDGGRAVTVLAHTVADAIKKAGLRNEEFVSSAVLRGRAGQ